MASSAPPVLDGSDRGPAVFAVTTATLSLCTAFVAARVYTRVFIVRRLSWDDKLIILAWLIAFGLSLTIDLGTSKGLGRHDENINPGDRGALRRCLYVFSILYNPALMATKSSVLIFYLRLSKNTQKVLRFASWLTLFVVNLAGTVLTLLNIFQCRPVAAGWEDIQGAQCIPLLTEFICAAPINIVTDLAILALPIPVLTSMRLPSRQKMILVFTFSLGIFVTVVDVVRIYYLQQAISEVPIYMSTDRNASFGGQEFAWNASLALAWSAVEVNVGTTCACIPTLKPLILRILPNILFDHGRASLRKSTQDEKDLTSSGSRKDCMNGDAHSPTTESPGAGGVLEGSAVQTSPRETVQFSTPTASAPKSEATGKKRTGMERSGRSARDPLSSDGSGRSNAVYFGFVNMTKPKSMLTCSAAEAWKYCSAVTILFLLWGASYGLLNSLNIAVAGVAGMTTAQTLGLTSAYFGGGYFFGPLLVGEWILRRDEHRRRTNRRRRTDSGMGPDGAIGGFKATFITGLCIYGTGTIIFWPCAVTKSWGGFMLCSFAVGFGLAVLETGANAFLILCGPPEHGETRLMFAQAIQAVGSVVAGVLAQRVFFARIDDAGESDAESMTLINVQWTYLAVTMICVVLALFFYYMPLPEVTDSDLERAASRLPVDPKKRSIGGLQLRTVCLILAVISQYMYSASQEGNNIFMRSLVISAVPGQPESGPDAAAGRTAPGSDPDQPAGLNLAIGDYLLIAHSAYAIARFIIGTVLYFSVTTPWLPKPRTILTTSISLSALFALLSIVVRPSDPNLLLIPVVLFYFCEGPAWALIFAIGLRGQGKRTKRAAAFITMGASGGAILPFVMYGIIIQGGTVRVAFIAVLVMQVCMGAFSVFLDVMKDPRHMTDPAASIGTTTVRTDAATEGDEQPGDDPLRLVPQRRMTMTTTSSAVPSEGENRVRVGLVGKVWESLGQRLQGKQGVGTGKEVERMPTRELSAVNRATANGDAEGSSGGRALTT